MPFGQVPKGFLFCLRPWITKWKGGMIVVKQTVAIVGAGNVGSTLAKAFYRQGYQLVGIASKTLANAEKLASLFGVPATIRAAEITQYADIVIIATPDRCISQVVEEVAQTGGFRARQVVLHTSGGMTVDSLSPASQLGSFTGCMHPLQSFADRNRDVDILVGTYFALGGHEQAVNLGEKIVRDFGGQSFVLLDQDRPLYHAAACIVSNYFVSLLHWATQLYQDIGLTPEQASKALMPLVQGTLKNVQQLGVTAALTGPVSRGDGNTISAHLTALKNSEQQKLYVALAHYTLGVAVGKGTVNEQQVAVIENLLNERMER